ncbi:FAD-dependent monooxygenase, partial [Streptomyces blattellae]|uniref:FAD-dependent monooxygenase n=1 Tax=Streptomyces blattellae TaxID=2569855 RepID=UPI0012B8EF60
LRASGAQIDLRAQGVDVVKRMGLLDAVEARQVHEAGFEMIDSEGRVKARMMPNTSGRGTASITSEYEIMRADFLRILYDAAKDRAEFRFDTMIERFEQDDEHVKVHFADGSSETFDLLVGADGQGSRIRRAILPPGAPDPYRRSGVNVAYWIVPRDESDSDIATMYNAPGGRLVIRRSHSETETQIYFFLRDNSPEARAIHRKPVDEQKRFYADKLRGAGWQTDRFLHALESSDNFYSQEVVQIVAERWHQGRVVLVGDAAHGLPPAGWGVTSSLIGSYIMANELERNAEKPSTAFGSYETAMRPFIKSKEPASFRSMRILLPSSRLGIRLFHTVGRTARPVMQNISKLRARLSTLASRDGGVGAWALPDYDDLLSPAADRPTTQNPLRRG